MSTTARPIKVTNPTQGGTYVPRDSENTVIRENTGKVTAVVAEMTVSSRNLKNNQLKTKTGQFKTKTANKSAIITETRSKSKQKIARSRQNRAGKHDEGDSYQLIVKNKTIRVLLDSGSSGDLLFLKKGASKHIPVIKRAVPQSWGTSNGTFVTNKVGNIKIAFVEYSSSKKALLRPDIVEYNPGIDKPMYDLIIGKETMHDLGVVLDFKEKTIQIDEILLPMRDIANLQLKTSVSRALKHNTSFAQEPVSTRSATKRVVEILDAKYKKADIPAIVRENCSHLSATDREKLLSLLLKYEELSDGTLADWNLPPVSFEIKEGTKPYHGKAYPIPHIHKAVLMKEIDRLCSIGVLKWQPTQSGLRQHSSYPRKMGQSVLFQTSGN